MAGNSRVLKSQRFQIYILLCRQNAQKAVIQQAVHITSNLIVDQFRDFLYTRTQTDAQHLSLFADDQNVGIQSLHHHFTDIIEYHLR